MDGFATVDLSTRDSSLTVWLTSVQKRAHVADANAVVVAHVNSVVFALDNAATPRRAWGMMFDRYVVLTDRTPRSHPVLLAIGVEPCDLAMLAKQATAAQAAVMAAFEAYSAKPGKADLVEPNLPPVPPPLDQAPLEAGSPEQLTLAVANHVMRTWAAWLTTERERVKRWRYMPGGRKGEMPSLLPAEFVQQNTVQARRTWTS